jgi:septal ring factor EnvC (AmiA/AmiB activator)
MQGENILHTQGLLRDRIGELSNNKQKKDEVLQTQSKEIDILADQQKEKNEAVSKLKAEGKELNRQIAAKKKQMQKVSNTISAAIKRAQNEARKDALAKAAEERKRKEEEKNNANVVGPESKPAIKNIKTTTSVAKPVSVLLATDADIKLNAIFESNRGRLPWPVERGYKIMSFGVTELPNKLKVDNPGLTIGSDIGSSVKAIFDGEVSSVTNIEDMQVVILKHGRYFSTYSNLSGVNLSRGQVIHTGQVIGKVAANDEGVGSIDLIISNEKGNLNPETWLRHK